jgi:hypothetical protein
MGTGESTASITVQTAATYTVTTTNASGCTSLQGSGVAAPKTTPTAPVNVVNNCDGTSTLTASEYTGTLLWALNCFNNCSNSCNLYGNNN